MTKYFLSGSGIVWAWKDEVTMLWGSEDPVWTKTIGEYAQDDLKHDFYLSPLEPEEVEEITGELPWK